MPIEFKLLKNKPLKIEKCPECGQKNPDYLMRGLIQRSKRFLGILWKRDYCLIICEKCKRDIGWESPENYL